MTDESATNGPLQNLNRVPLLQSMTGRRSRRVARGTSIDAGELSHVSHNAPLPLTELEEAILIVATGITGVVAHDGPLESRDHGAELGTPFLNVIARSAPSPDNSQPTHFVMINDDGIWLLKRPPRAEVAQMLAGLPPRFGEWSERDWIATAAAVRHRLRSGRLEMPREFPYYVGWNKQMSNVPGTTIFLPLVDTTRMMINGILNLLAEPDGQRPLFVDDWRGFEPKNAADWAGWVASETHLIKHIPYQPIGGVHRARDGFVNPKIPMPVGFVRTFLSDHESFYLTHNLMLVSEAMGLGSWIHACAPSPYLLGGDSRTKGLGLRMEKPHVSKLKWPPLPSTQPNPVGIDGLFETLSPPYVSSMDEAVDRVLDLKYGEAGAYADPAVFGHAYREREAAAWYLRHGHRYTQTAIDYAKEICNYIWDTYGRFPAHVDAVYQPGTWLQVAHLELEYYEKYFEPSNYTAQSAHARVWGHG